MKNLLRQEILNKFPNSRIYYYNKNEFSFFNNKNLYQIQKTISREKIASFISGDLYQNIPRKFMEFHKRYNSDLIDNKKDIIIKKSRTLWCGLLCEKENYNFKQNRFIRRGRKKKNFSKSSK